MNVDFHELAQLGYPIIPVIPPSANADPSRGPVTIDRRLAPGAGKMPGIRERIVTARGDLRGWGPWHPLKGWTSHVMDEGGRKLAQAAGANAGCLLGTEVERLYVFDIDITDEKMAGAARAAVDAAIPGVVWRIGRPPKAMGFVRLAPGYQALLSSRHKLQDRKGGDAYVVEFLGKGCQAVIAGIHPSTLQPYEWFPDLLPVTALQQATPDQMQAALVAALASVEALGLSVVTSGRHITSASEQVQDQGQFLAPSIGALSALVDALPNNVEDFGTRDAWLKIGYAIRAAAGEENEDEAFLLWAGWSARYDGENPASADECHAEWRRLLGPYRLGWGWLQAKARDYGFETAGYDFAAEGGDDEPPAGGSGGAGGTGSDGPTGPSPVVAQASLPSAASRAMLESAEPYSERHVAGEVARSDGWRLLWVREEGLWRVWDGRVWGVDGQTAGLLISSACSRLAGDLTTADPGRGSASWARKMGSAGFQRGVEIMLQSKLGLDVSVSDFDTDPWLLNTPVGVVDLRTGRVRAHDPALRMTMITAAGPEGPAGSGDGAGRGGGAEVFLGLLRDIFDPAGAGPTDQSLADAAYMIRVCSYCLSGDMSLHLVHFLFGGGANGKSTLLDFLVRLLGGYATQVKADTFVERRQGIGGSRWGLAQWPGKRLVVASEVAEGSWWDSELLKDLSSGDMIQAEAKYMMPFVFRPQAKILISGNSQPRLRATDYGIARRLRIVPFLRRFDRPDTRMGARLWAARGAIMGLLVREAALLWQDGLRDGAGPEVVMPPSPAVLLAGAEYQAKQDLVALWIEDRCVPDPGRRLGVGSGYADFRNWCLSRGEPVYSARRWGDELVRLGHPRWRSNADRGFSGLMLAGELDVVDG